MFMRGLQVVLHPNIVKIVVFNRFFDLTLTLGHVPVFTQNFISDIRGAQNKEQEQRRVEKELAKIRERFSDDKSLSGKQE